MSSSDSVICPACGARNAPGAAHCELCGTPFDPAVGVEASGAEASGADRTPSEPPAESPPGPAAAAEGPASGVYCNQCGWKNPPGARFCSQCGARLQEVPAAAPRPAVPVLPGTRPAAPPEPPAAPDVEREEASPVRRQIALLVGISAVLVVALFLVTSVSKELQAPPAGSAAAPSMATTPEDPHEDVPLPASVAEQVARLEAAIDAADGAERLARQRELVNLYIGVGRYGSAAQIQEAIATAANTAEDWRRAGDLFYDWMDTLQDQTPEKRAAADRAIQAYQRALELDPDNLDVRTDMATAYLQSSSPMLGVQEIKAVLDEDPNHLQARFNYGIMLSMINRPEQAIEQFEAVQRIAGPESPFYRQAEEAIAALRSSPGS
ncbi:hypothetical protein AWN76_004455 [Rhodothermaceae bacterium RA]|nr:hypothetical protein AWN76_004455 [Rhodothermaceae bacterium RA]